MNKESQKKHIIEIMQSDEKDALYKICSCDFPIIRDDGGAEYCGECGYDL